MKIKILKTIGLALLLATTTISNAQLKFVNPPQEPALFGGTMINSSAGERDFALSPDGTELFYTLQSPRSTNFQTIVYRKKNAKGVWSKPSLAPFAGNYSDLEPFFSQDGNELFFSSNRPLNGKAIKDFDIWYVKKEKGKWGEPHNLGSPINTDKDEFYPSVAANGNLYFTAAYSNAIGKEDIYIARWNINKYEVPVPLDSAVNSKTYEFNAFVSPDESYIIFSSYGRNDDRGGGDLYMSTKNENGYWQPAKALQLLNSEKIDYCPFVSADKKILFFTSERTNLQNFYDQRIGFEELKNNITGLLNGSGNIYWVSFEKILSLYK